MRNQKTDQGKATYMKGTTRNLKASQKTLNKAKANHMKFANMTRMANQTQTTVST